jgi:hypothetical protein
MTTYTARLPVRRPTRWYLLGRGLSRLAALTVAVAAARYALPRVPSTPATVAVGLLLLGWAASRAGESAQLAFINWRNSLRRERARARLVGLDRPAIESGADETFVNTLAAMNAERRVARSVRGGERYAALKPLGEDVVSRQAFADQVTGARHRRVSAGAA